MAPQTSVQTIKNNAKNQKSMLYVLLLWSLGAMVILLMFGFVFSAYRTLPTPLTAEMAGKSQFSEQRFVFVNIMFIITSILRSETDF
jgi:Na+/melibiose symporter-like transporter